MKGLMVSSILLASGGAAFGDEVPLLPDLPFKGHCEAEAAKKEARARADAEVARRGVENPLPKFAPAKRGAVQGDAAMANARDAGRAAHLAQQAAQCAMHCGRR